MAKTKTSALKEAEKALKEAQERYERLKNKTQKAPDFIKQVKEINAIYAQKLKELNRKRQNTEHSYEEAIKKLKSAYEKRHKDIIYDSIKKGVARSSIINDGLYQNKQEKNAELALNKSKLKYETAKLKDNISRLENERASAVEKVADKKKQYEEKEKYIQELQSAKKAVDQAKAIYKTAQKDDKSTAKSHSQEIKRPSGISDKNWDRAVSAYNYLKDKKKSEIVKYIKDNAYRLKMELGDAGLWWLEQSFGLINNSHYRR